MTEVITRPKSGKTKATLAVPVAQQAPVTNEGDKLALKAAEILQTMYMAAAYHDDGGPHTKDNSHFNVVDHLLGLLLAPECHERCAADPECGDIHEHLTQIADELQYGASLMDKRPLANLDAPMQSMYAAMAHRASDYADRLFSAYSGLPGTLEDLRHLTTFAGMRPFRERPQPPIRRVEAESTPANELNRKQLVRVLEHVATSISLMDDLLMQAVQMEDIPREVLNLISWAEFMARQIGAAADQATGSWIVGGLNEWNCGSDFAQLGKAGTA